MTISPANLNGALAPVTEHTRDLRADHDHGSDDFAGLLAGAMNAPAPKPEQKPVKDGTSELDRQDDDAAEEKKKVKHGRAHGIAAHATAATSNASSGDVVQS